MRRYLLLSLLVVGSVRAILADPLMSDSLRNKSYSTGTHHVESKDPYPLSRTLNPVSVITTDNVEAQLYRTFEGLNTTFQFDIPDPIVIPAVPLADSMLEKRNHAHALHEKVLGAQRFLESLDALQEIDLPVGVVKSGGVLDYSILIDRITFTSRGAMMDVYMSLALPQTGDQIAFHGKVPLSATGGIAGSAKIYLLGDHPIKISGTSLLTIKGTNNTYVEFDCNGFQGMSIEAEVQFSRDFIVPEDEKGNIIGDPARVKTSFTTYIQSWNDLMVGVTIPPFQVKGLKGFGFSVQQAFMDWSDLANPPGLVFPPGYISPFTQGNLWQGFYLQRLEIKLPSSFTDNRQSGSRVTLGVEHMILDDQGFSGTVFAEHIIEAGDMSGWGYSLDRIGLELATNQIKGFELAGKLSVPVIKGKDGKTTQFGYLAQRGADGNYIFAIKIENEVKLPVFVADVNLFTGSSIIVKERDNKFYPAAILNGELTITAGKTSFNSIRFENLKISSEAPHFSLGTFGFGREGQDQSVSKFPVVISNIMTKSEGERVGIGLDLTINIGGKSEEGGFGGTGSLIVWGKREATSITNAEGQVTGSQQGDWKFDKVELSGIDINYRKPGVIELAGMIRFFEDDQTYGDGFKGTVNGKIQSVAVRAEALFGRTETFRYWYADALAELETGIAIVPGVMSAYGFGGGFYSKMKQTTQSVASPLGRTESGITYIPDENTIGIRAIVLIGAARKEAWNGDVSLEVMLNRHGGINSVTFTGNANFMSPLAVAGDKIKELASASVSNKLAEKLASLVRGQVYGSVKLHFDNVNDVFHGNLEIYVNVAGGLVRGVSDGNKAGWAVLHFEKNDWYVLIGTPDQPIGLEVARIFKAKSYFMLGKNLPGSPPPPSQVTEILGNVDLDYMRDMNALQSGTGFAFGLHFLVDTGDLTFLMFYGRFAAGAGVDFMLKDYGTNVHCAGSSGPMGINGWYANGQAYAFVMGKIGIKVNLRFYKGKYEILSIGAAAILQTKGPNPFWMKGTVGGYYRILGGMVKGKCRFEVTVGKDCKPVGEQNLLEDVNMIAEISPAKNSTDVDVFNTPQVAFNIPVGEVFEITDLENKVHSFRAVLDEFIVLDNTQPIVGTLEWNTERDVVVFDGRDILPGQKKITAKAKLTFEERINGVWTKVKFDGKIVEETTETTFETGKAPDFIPPNNVLISYPLAGQVNFYPKEYNQGFVQLKDGQPYLFKPGPEWIQKVRMSDAATQRYIESDLAYNEIEKKVLFSVPGGFENAKVYDFEILNMPRHSTIIDANVQKIETELVQNEEAGTATLTTKEVEGQINRLEVKTIYSSNFRTSKYNTFIDKMKDMSLAQTARVDIDINIFQLAAYLRGDELFESAEVNGGPNYGKIIQLEAVLSVNTWYQNYVYPLVYEGYPLLGWMKVRRATPEILGIPPVRDIYFSNFKQNLALDKDNLGFTTTPFSYEYVAYNLGESVTADYRAIQHQAVNYVADHPSQLTPRLESLIMKPIPYVRYGAYRFKLNYVIPGVNKISSSYEWELFNRIPDNE